MKAKRLAGMLIIFMEDLKMKKISVEDKIQIKRNKGRPIPILRRLSALVV